MSHDILSQSHRVQLSLSPLVTNVPGWQHCQCWKVPRLTCQGIVLDTKACIIKEFLRGSINSDLMKEYRLSKSTISSIAKCREGILTAAILDANSGRKRLEESAYKNVGDTLLNGFWTLMQGTCQQTGHSSNHKLKMWPFSWLPRVQTGDRWLHHFKGSQGVVCNSVTGEEASINKANAECWLHDNIGTVQQYSACGVYNTDKTGLFFQMLPSATDRVNGDKCVGGKHSKLQTAAFLFSYVHVCVIPTQQEGMDDP